VNKPAAQPGERFKTLSALSAFPHSGCVRVALAIHHLHPWKPEKACKKHGLQAG
jgi:hypothetical protein